MVADFDSEGADEVYEHVIQRRVLAWYVSTQSVISCHVRAIDFIVGYLSFLLRWKDHFATWCRGVRIYRDDGEGNEHSLEQLQQSTGGSRIVIVVTWAFISDS